MGRDNQPKHRQAKQIARKQGKRQPYDRILIVCEGSKTEPLYFEEIRQHYWLPATHINVLQSQLGTDPLNVVRSAKDLFENGNPYSNIRPRAFEKVYAIFDRDDHSHYHDALRHADDLNDTLKNDDKRNITFKAIASVPNFELWLLLHFEDIQHALHRDDVIDRLKQHLTGYEKGQGGHFARTKHLLSTALDRAHRLTQANNAYNGEASYTDVGKLVKLLTTLKPD